MRFVAFGTLCLMLGAGGARSAFAGSYSVSNSGTTYLQTNGHWGIQYPYYYPAGVDWSGNQSTSFTLPKFNHSLGTLASVSLQLQGSGTYDWNVHWHYDPDIWTDSGAEVADFHQYVHG